ncbi:squalene--hopene cyclase [Thiohalorhabdus denitrificans]|uniref:Squalene-hopene/tetraprenyl-beta-curcumene cyclase n=1 Tax=Thiohalorhabdus denitrificans TaxID=381306 RepID=A0A1G5AVR8_9GAMM|nr:squalene--hopene cyclase [Thiohalorhabdus denitrificans]SCX81999.1 squalene-hopene/tetraprenyl-beta-curcumene cyclase [Thiohalorhabdus denitrificans]
MARPTSYKDDALGTTDQGGGLRTTGYPLDQAIAAAEAALVDHQFPDGHWCFELEGDCTITAEYILMMHFMGEIDPGLQERMVRYLRARRDPAHGGWPLYPGGPFDVSGSVKAYYALKLAGVDPEETPMAEAREAILAHGGAARSNVFTRFLLAQFGQIPWRGVPMVPAEIVLLPTWFPFHLSKVSYWARTVMVPLSILYTRRVRARNPQRLGVRELFTVPPERERRYFPVWSWPNRLILSIERTAARAEPLFPQRIRERAVHEAAHWFIERLNGEHGLGGIFPAMVYAYEALDHLGYGPDHPYRIRAGRALRNLVVERGDEAYCQPCLSPVWDTALACHALTEANGGTPPEEGSRGMDWLRPRQVEEGGDWTADNPDLAGGGWCFQYENPHYPDLDDTATVANLLHNGGDSEQEADRIRRAVDWVVGMQSRDGGFGAFNADNTYHYLNEIPFADHGALLDPPTSDVTARCVGLLGRVDHPEAGAALRGAVDFLQRAQEPEGPWFGRWGTNYVYGTWSVLEGLSQAGLDMNEAWIRQAVRWLKSVQRPDGGWGEENDTYFQPERARRAPRSTPFQTAWALLGLMAAGEARSPAVRAGVDYLLATQGADGGWEAPWFTAPGFPRVFHLKYHGYNKYFPLQALARYRNQTGGTPR